MKRFSLLALTFLMLTFAGCTAPGHVVATPPTGTLLVVTGGDALVESAVRSIDDDVLVVTPYEYESGDYSGFQVTVFDGYAPSKVPATNAIYFGVVPPVPGVSIDAPDGTSGTITSSDRDADVLDAVEFDEIFIAVPPTLQLPASASILASTAQGPVIAELQSAQTRHLIVSFDPLDSNWPFKRSFIVFVANAVDVLGRG